jgi:hypothetical protein
VLNGFSAHADQNDLVTTPTRPEKRASSGRSRLVHGDPQPQKVLKQRLEDASLGEVFVPAKGDRLDC